MRVNIFVFVLILIITSCTYSFGQQIQKLTITKTYICSSHDYVINDLENNYGKSRKGYAVSSSNELIELFVNKSSGEWTIIYTNQHNLTCGLAGGNRGFTFQLDTSSDRKL
jgi:hypothetical protein